MTEVSTELDSGTLAGLGNIPAEYRHSEKLITPGPDLALPGSYLKWYDVRLPEVEIPAELAAEGRQFLADEVAAGRLAIDGELGFVICHRCGESFYFLLVCTWRNQNEMWESVYAQDLAGRRRVRPGAAGGSPGGDLRLGARRGAARAAGLVALPALGPGRAGQAGLPRRSPPRAGVMPGGHR